MRLLCLTDHDFPMSDSNDQVHLIWWVFLVSVLFTVELKISNFKFQMQRQCQAKQSSLIDVVLSQQFSSSAEHHYARRL